MSAVPCRRHALRARKSERGDVIVVPRFRAARVEAHPDAHGDDFAPVFLVQCALGGQRGGERVAGVLEHRAETVAEHVKHVAAMRADRALQ